MDDKQLINDLLWRIQAVRKIRGTVPQANLCAAGVTCTGNCAACPLIHPLDDVIAGKHEGTPIVLRLMFRIQRAINAGSKPEQQDVDMLSLLSNGVLTPQSHMYNDIVFTGFFLENLQLPPSDMNEGVSIDAQGRATLDKLLTPEDNNGNT